MEVGETEISPSWGLGVWAESPQKLRVDWRKAQAPGCSAQNLPHPLVSHLNWSQPKGSVPTLLARWESQLLKVGGGAENQPSGPGTLGPPITSPAALWNELEFLGCLGLPYPETSKSETRLMALRCRVVEPAQDLDN